MYFGFSQQFISHLSRMSVYKGLQRLACCGTQRLEQEEDEVDKLLKSYLKVHVVKLCEDEKAKLYEILRNLSDFQKFLYEAVVKNHVKSKNPDLTDFNFHPNIINIIFLLAKIGLLETCEVFNDIKPVANYSTTKTELELEVIRETSDNNSNDHVPLDILLDDVSTKVEAKRELDELLSKEVNISNVRNFQFSELKKATNFFNEDRYEELSKPGRQVGPGRLGKVFLGVNLVERTPLVAIKKVRQVKGYMEYFLRELITVSELKHPNIIQLLGYSVDEVPCLVYEYTPDGSLKHFLENENFVRTFFLPKDRVSTLLQVASALKYLHCNKNIFHGDIKPENIMLGRSVKLCGFGLISDDSVSKEVTNRIAGTNFHMAPELINDDYSCSSDIYAFGVVMMQVLTGLEVFDCQRGELERYLVSLKK